MQDIRAQPQWLSNLAFLALITRLDDASQRVCFDSRQRPKRSKLRLLSMFGVAGLLASGDFSLFFVYKKTYEYIG